MALNGLSQINIELSSKCDKSCSFCGHQNVDINKQLEYGDIDLGLLSNISYQLPPEIVVQFHRDGEPLVFHAVGLALRLFRRNITSIVTNGKKLVEKAIHIVGNCDTVTVSAFHGDPDGPEQLEILKEFLRIKGKSRPQVIVKIIGDYPGHPFGDLGVPVIHRLIHNPDGNKHYAHRNPTVPEIGICLDFLSHPSIDWQGNFYICNRLDSDRKGLLGNLNESTIDELWNGELRKSWFSEHRIGRRDLVSACKNCKFWGVPSGYDPVEHGQRASLIHLS